MNDLIEALQIFARYGNPYSPTHCEHDELMVMIDPEVVSGKDKARLDELGFIPSYTYGEGMFLSYRFGSA